MKGRPNWLTRERGLALAGLFGLFVVGVICLAMILSAGGDDGEQAAAAPAATAAPTQAPSPTPTPTPTPVPLTPAQRAERRAAADQVRQQGYEPVSLKAYHPDQNLRVLLGEAEGAAAAAGRRAFFFVDGQFIGTDATEPSAELRISKQTNNTVTLRYGLNTGEEARVRFKWEAGTLSPQTPIPPALQRQG